MSFSEIDDDLLLAYADGELSDARRAEVEALLADAPELRADLDRLRRLQRRLRATLAAADTLPPPPARVWANVARRAERDHWRWLGPAFGAAACLLIVLGIGALIGLKGGRPAAGPPPTTAAPPATLRQGTLALVRDGQIILRDMATGQERALSGIRNASAPAWSPGGGAVLFLAETDAGRALRQFDLGSGAVTAALPADANAKFQARSRAAWAGPNLQIADIEYREPNPAIQPGPRGAWIGYLSNGGIRDNPPVGLAEPDVAPGGSLAVAVSLLGDSKLVFLPGNNAPPALPPAIVAPPGVTFHWPAFAPDGQRLAVFERAADGTATLVTFDLPDVARHALITFRTDEPLFPQLNGLTWSPDGQMLALAFADANGQARVRFFRLDGAGVTTPELAGTQPAWTAARPLEHLAGATPPTSTPPTPAPPPTALPTPDAAALWSPGMTPTRVRAEGQVTVSEYASGLVMAAGPAGCCLDADPRKTGEPVALPGSTTGHYLAGDPATGGPILWWPQGHSYIALSGAHLTRDDLVRAATAMVQASLPPPRSDRDVADGPLPGSVIAWSVMRYPERLGGCNRLVVQVLRAGERQPAERGPGCLPVVSPDRNWIAVFRAEGSVLVPTGGGQEISVGRYASEPGWSPDSRRLAFAANDRGANGQLYVFDLDTRSLRQVTSFASGLATDIRGIVPFWSPDGTRIAFSAESHPAGGTANWDIYLVNADGSGLTRLTASAANEYVLGWSPDSTRLLFSSDRDRERMQLFVIGVDGSGETRLADGDGAAWSPDGRWIAFVSNDPERQLFLVPADRSAPPRRLTTIDSLYGPIWSADGRWISVSAFFERERAGAIFVVPAGGGPPVRVAHSDQWLQWAGR